MKFKIETITTKDDKRIIYINFDGKLTEETFTDSVRNDMIQQITDEIFNSNELKKQFFICDKIYSFLEILEQIGEVEKDNKYIDLSKYEYFNTGDFIDADIDDMISIIHKPFIIECLEGDYYDIEGNINEEEKLITYYI